MYILRLAGLEHKVPITTAVHYSTGMRARGPSHPSAACLHCGRRFLPDEILLDLIRGIMRDANLSPGQSPCMALPAEAWDYPALLSNCPRCQRPLLFNPFILDNRDSAPGVERPEETGKNDDWYMITPMPLYSRRGPLLSCRTCHKEVMFELPGLVPPPRCPHCIPLEEREWVVIKCFHCGRYIEVSKSGSLESEGRMVLTECQKCGNIIKYSRDSTGGKGNPARSYAPDIIWYEITDVGDGHGGDIEVTCTRCGHSITYSPGMHEKLPVKCRKCGYLGSRQS